MHVVTQEVFYDVIGPQDAVVSILNPYSFPYTNIFSLRNGSIIGKVVSRYGVSAIGEERIVKIYYLTNKP